METLNQFYGMVTNLIPHEMLVLIALVMTAVVMGLPLLKKFDRDK